VLTAVAFDRDFNDSIIYELMASDHSNLFGMDQEGRISLIGRLDFEKISEYRLQVKAFNPYSSSDRHGLLDVIVHVQDEDESVPRFFKRFERLEISRHSRPGTILGRLKALDLDTGSAGLISYYGSSSSPIRIDRNLGEFVLTKPFDETERTFNITIMAKNKRTLINNTHSRWE
jgi:hypothetical protein